MVEKSILDETVTAIESMGLWIILDNDDRISFWSREDFAKTYEVVPWPSDTLEQKEEAG